MYKSLIPRVLQKMSSKAFWRSDLCQDLEKPRKKQSYSDIYIYIYIYLSQSENNMGVSDMNDFDKKATRSEIT